MSVNPHKNANVTPARTVYVVRKTLPGRDPSRFVAAEHTPAGAPREYDTLAEATAAALRLGGRPAGVSVFTEFRAANGAPCSGLYIRSGVEDGE